MLRKNVHPKFRNRKGQSLVEYGILIGGIALVCLAAVAILGHKTNDLIAVVAGVLPGAHTSDNGPIVSGQLVLTETDTNDGAHVLSTQPGHMSNLGMSGFSSLVVDPSATSPFAPADEE